MVRRPWSSLVCFSCSSFLSRLALLRARRRQYRRGLKLRRRESRFVPVAVEVLERRVALSGPTAVQVLASTPSAAVGQQVTFTGKFTDTDQNAAITDTWILAGPTGGSSHNDAPTLVSGQGTDQFQFTPTATGTYTITFTPADGQGNAGVALATVTVGSGSSSGSGSGSSSGSGSGSGSSSGSGSGSSSGSGSGSTAPQVTGVTPSTGNTAGGGSVTITGLNFNQVQSVEFGTTIITNFTVNSPTQITAVVPQHSAGNVDVIVVTATGISSLDPTHDQYHYVTGGPTVTNVSPGTGTSTGGSSITITGSGFSQGVTDVAFGGSAATSWVVNSDTSITAVAPTHTAGQVDVVVSTLVGNSTVNQADHFVYTAPVLTPIVTSLSASTGPASGGTQVTIFGTNFTNISAVFFGGQAASSFTVNSASSITAVTAAATAPAAVDVTVTNSAGTSGTSASDRFTFQATGPTITGLSVARGSTAGGTIVTIAGKNLLGTTGVFFGGVAATNWVLNSPGSITAIAPVALAGVVDVTVHTAGGTSAVTTADRFTYAAPVPVVTSLGVTAGTIAGGTPVMIFGDNLDGATGVSFGNTPAASFFTANGTIFAVAPAGTAGAADITVTTPLGTSATGAGDRFTFQDPAAGGSGSDNPDWTQLTNSGSFIVDPQAGSGLSTPGGMLLGAGPGPQIGQNGLFVIPTSPTVPVNDPHFTETPDYAHNSYTWTDSDGGSTDTGSSNSYTSPDGSVTTYSETWHRDFTYYAGGTNAPGGSNSQMHLEVNSSYIINVSVTFADGSGSTSMTTSDDHLTWDSSSDSSGGGNFNYEDHGDSSHDLHQTGVSGAGADDHLDFDDGNNDSYRHTSSGSTTAGVTTGNFSDMDMGGTHFSHNDTRHDGTHDDEDGAGGSSNSMSLDGGVFTLNGSGTGTTMRTYNTQSSGNDNFSSNDTDTITTNVPDATGSTTIVDHSTFTEQGGDNFSFSTQGYSQTFADGSSTSNETHDEHDGGQDDVQIGDHGTIDWTDIAPDGGTIVGHDDFDDSNDDNSDYSDRDDGGSNSGSGGFGTLGTGGNGSHNDIDNEDDDTDQSHTSDNETVTWRQVSATGGVTTVTFSETPLTDDGNSSQHDDVDDQEGSGTGGGTGDSSGSGTNDFNFHNKSHHDDTVKGTEKIVIRTLGLMAAGTSVDSTETLTIAIDHLKSESNFKDDGTEDDTSSGDTENDTEHDDSSDDDKFTITDSSNSTTTTTADDGTVTKTESQGLTSDDITAGDDSGNDDTHNASSGAGGSNESDTDDDNFNDSSNFKDEYTGYSHTKTTVTKPVAGGTLTTTSESQLSNLTGTATEDSGDSGEVNTANPSADNSTGHDDASNYDQGEVGGSNTATLDTTDPVTGMKTHVYTSSMLDEQFVDDFSDNLSGTGTTPDAPPSETEHVDAKHQDNNIQKGQSFDWSISGSPAPGVTTSIGQQLSISENNGSDMQHYHDDATGSGPSDETDTGESDSTNDEHDTIGGGGFNNVTLNVQVADSNGNSVSINESNNDSRSITGTANDDDSTRDDFGDVNGQETSDAETDTEQEGVDLTATDDDTTNEHDNVTFTDPATGIKTTVTFDNNGSTENLSDHMIGNATDTHHAGTGTPTPDDVSGGGGDDEHDDVSQHLQTSVTVQGSDGQGGMYNVTQKVTLDDSDSDHFTDNVSEPEGAPKTETAHNHDVGNAQITDRLTGSITTVDPTTGIKSVVTMNDFVSGNEQDTEDDGDTETTPTNGTPTDVTTKSESESDSVNWNIKETTTQFNADGTPLGAPNAVNDSAGDSESINNGVTTDLGNTSPPAASSGNGNASAFAVTAVAIAGDTAAEGSVDGGDAVVISGTGFTGDSQVSFGGVAADSTIVVSSTQIIAIAPQHAVGSVDVTVSNALGTSVSSADDIFQYADKPPAGGGTTTQPPGSPPVTTGGTGTQSTRGLVIPDLDPSQIDLFLTLAKAGKELEDRMKVLINEREIALRYAGYALHPQGRGARIDRDAMLAKAAEIDQRLAGLQGEMEGLQYEYQHAGLLGLDVTGYPQGLTDNGQHGEGVGGNDFGGAVAAYRQALTNIGGQDGLIQTEGPLEFALTMGAGKLLKLGAAAAAKRAAQGAKSSAVAPLKNRMGDLEEAARKARLDPAYGRAAGGEGGAVRGAGEGSKALDKLQSIEKAQQRVRSGSDGGKRIIDSIEKSKQRLDNKLKGPYDPSEWE